MKMFNCIRFTRYTSFLSVHSRYFSKGGSHHHNPVKNSTQQFSQTGHITWYPGHIAKAEKELVNHIKLVDIVVEVRDARIIASTTHPLVSKWVGNRPIIVVIARIDSVPPRCIADWKAYYQKYPPHQGSKVLFVDGNRGDGIERVRSLILKAGVPINEKRAKLGMEPRSVRAAIIGFPNVGKSSIINRILNRKLAAVQNVAGFTKRIQWVRVGEEENKQQQQPKDGNHSKPPQKFPIELLDTPGIIPPQIHDQNSAMALAICKDIGDASYDKVKAAASLCDRVIAISKERKGYVSIPSVSSRYKISFAGDLTGEQIVNLYAEKQFHSQDGPAAEKLLSDFRKGYWGVTALEYPPNVQELDEDRERERQEKRNLAAAVDKKIEEKLQKKKEEKEKEEKEKEKEEEFFNPFITKLGPSSDNLKERFIAGSSDKGPFDGW